MHTVSRIDGSALAQQLQHTPKQTVAHYLLDCPAYGEQRARLARALGPAKHY